MDAPRARLGRFRLRRKGEADTGPLSVVVEGGLPAGSGQRLVRFMTLGRAVRVKGGLDEYASFPPPTPESMAERERAYARTGGHVPYDASQTAEADAASMQLTAQNGGPDNQKLEGIPLVNDQ